MSKLIGITQRVDFIKSYAENRDCLDISWYKFLKKINLTPLPLPNLPINDATKLIKMIKIDGLILSGGNTLHSCNPKGKDVSKLRDDFEFLLIDHALKNNIPIIGICRGMQVINKYFNGRLVKIDNDKSKHTIIKLDKKLNLPKRVNSFHNWGIRISDLPSQLSPTAVDEKNFVEAFIHQNKKLVGLMWHPERDFPVNKINLNIFKKLFS